MSVPLSGDRPTVLLGGECLRLDGDVLGDLLRGSELSGECLNLGGELFCLLEGGDVLLGGDGDLLCECLLLLLGGDLLCDLLREPSTVDCLLEGDDVLLGGDDVLLGGDDVLLGGDVSGERLLVGDIAVADDDVLADSCFMCCCC